MGCKGELVMKLFSFLVFFAAAAFAASFASEFNSDGWNVVSNKPSWTPSERIFELLWAISYLLMAIAAFQVWQERHPLSPRSIGWWLGLLGLNIAWSWLFFGFHSPGLALIEMSILLIVLSATIRLFWRVKRSAASLLTPYLMWLSFVWILNLVIWWLNGSGLKITEFFH